MLLEGGRVWMHVWHVAGWRIRDMACADLCALCRFLVVGAYASALLTCVSALPIKIG